MCGVWSYIFASKYTNNWDMIMTSNPPWKQKLLEKTGMNKTHSRRVAHLTSSSGRRTIVYCPTCQETLCRDWKEVQEEDCETEQAKKVDSAI